MSPTEKHISWERILEALDSPDAAASVHEHLRGCPRCAERRADAEELVQLLRDARLPVVPEALASDTLPRVLALARERDARRAAEASPSGSSPWLERMRAAARELIAVLSGDSLTPTHALRGGGGPRVLRYEAGDYALSIALAEGPRGRQLRGQVTPRTAAELPESRRALLHVTSREAEVHIVDSEVSEFGEFLFDSVPVGEVHLSILAGEEVIRVEVETAGPSPKAE